MYGQQQYDSLSLFMILGLLSIAPPQTINQHLETLSFALDATSRSMDSLKQGMDTFHTGLDQLSHPAVTNPNTGPDTSGESNLQEDNFQENNFQDNNIQESDFQGEDFGAHIQKDMDSSFSTMPVKEPDINKEGRNELKYK